MNFVCLSLGSNLGNRLGMLSRAIDALHKEIFSLRCSVVLETQALLYPDSPDSWNLPFFNAVVVGETKCSPEKLLRYVKGIEKNLGRKESAKWAPRPMDIDVLLYGDQQHVNPDIPHPRLLERPFLITLIALLVPDMRLVLPGSPHHNKTFAALSREFPHSEKGLVLSPQTQLMGVVNITDNSMSDGGSYMLASKAIHYIQQLYFDGASIIDLGAQATNPRVKKLLSAEEEWIRLEPVLQQLATLWTDAKQRPAISIDTFYPEVIRRAIDVYPIQWINDVSGGSEEMMKVAKEQGLILVMNHSFSLPPKVNEHWNEESPVVEQILKWGIQQIECCQTIGLPMEQTILDPGIGFGTTPVQSVSILQQASKLKSLGVPILIGHSRKSFYNVIGKSNARDRDEETLGSSIALQQAGIRYLRIHNVKQHQRALAAAWLSSAGYCCL